MVAGAENSTAGAERDRLADTEYVTRRGRYGLISFLENDDPIGQCLLRYGEWAEGEIALLARLIGSGDTVLDIGANVGCHSVAFARLVGEEGRVLAFEPQPHLHALLARNAVQNGLSQLETLCCGVGETAGELWMPRLNYSTVSNFGAVRLKSEAETDEEDQRVPITTVDMLDLEACRLLKIDVEGMELQVLKGANATLARLKPLIYAEINNIEAGAQLVALMKDHGYEAYYHATTAFNPDNFFGSDDNFLGEAHESNLLFIPSHCAQEISLVRDFCRKVDSLDDLARAFLETPRWGEPEVQAAPLVLSRRLVSLEDEIAGLRAEIAQFQPLHDEVENLRHLLQRAHAERKALKSSMTMQRGLQLEGLIGRLQRPPLRPFWHSLRLSYRIGRALYSRATKRRRVRQLIEGSNLFDRDYYLSQTDETPDDPIRHYLEKGSRSGLRPNPLFDPVFYRRTYPDIAESGEEPLVHFVTVGAGEGRQPSPAFHSGFYLSVYADVAESGLNPLAHFLATGQAEGRRPSPFFDPDREPELIKEIKLLAAEDCPRILMISHVHGGGTERHIQDLAAMFRERAEFFYLTPSPDWSNAVRLTCIGRNSRHFPPIQINVSQGVGELAALLSRLELSRLHIHHTIGTLGWLRATVEALDLPFDVTIHDYYLVSPDPHLAVADGRYRGEEATEAGLVGLDTPNSDRPLTDSEWQASTQWILERAQRVIVPSVDVKRRLGKFVGEERLILAPHPEADAIQRPVKPPALSRGEALRIVVPGTFAVHKGAGLVEACEIACRQLDLPIELTVIGGLAPHYRLSPYSLVRFTGPYEEDQFDDLVAQSEPHLAWFPAQCPETYSYTLSHCLRLGLPVVASDLGAFPERLAGREWSWVAPWDMPPEAYCDFFAQLRERHFLPGTPPAPQGEVPTGYQMDFYSSRYLPLQGAANSGEKRVGKRRLH